MKDFAAHFAGLHWGQQLLFLTLCPDVLCPSFLEGLTELEAQAEHEAHTAPPPATSRRPGGTAQMHIRVTGILLDPSRPSRIHFARELAGYALGQGIEHAYEFAWSHRRRQRQRFPAMVRDEEAWASDIDLLTLMAMQWPIANQHVICALRLGLETEIIPEERVALRAEALARWSLAVLCLPTPPTQEQFAECMERLGEAHRLSSQADEPNACAVVLYIKGIAHHWASRWGFQDVTAAESAVTDLQAALQHATDNYLMGAILLQHAEARQRTHTPLIDTEIDVIDYTWAQTCAGLARDDDMLAASHEGLGRAFYHRQIGSRRENLEQSLQHYEQASDLQGRMGNTIRQGQIALDLAGVHVALSAMSAVHWDAARALYEEWRDAFPSDQYPFEAAQVCHGLGLLLSQPAHCTSAEEAMGALEQLRTAEALYVRAGRADALPGLHAATALVLTKVAPDSQTTGAASTASGREREGDLTGAADALATGMPTHDLAPLGVHLPDMAKTDIDAMKARRHRDPRPDADSDSA